MPRYLKQDGKKVPNIRTQKAWIVIPAKAKTTPINTESYLVQTRVADYIEKLERKIDKLTNTK